MIFRPLEIEGAYAIEPEKFADKRGFFARTFCEQQFAERGLCTRFPQMSVSFNAHQSTLRGMHFQAAPHQEIKVVRCTRGAVLDVVVDLRPDSPTWKKWCGVELTEENHLALYIPTGCAHGFLTLRENSELFYQISAEYHAASARGVRFDDAAFGIDWPHAPNIIAEKDRCFPDYESELLR